MLRTFGKNLTLGIDASPDRACSLATVIERIMAIATGDLSGPELTPQLHDEFARLVTAVNQMQSNLREMMRFVERNSQSLVIAEAAISAGSIEGIALSTQQHEQATLAKGAIEELFSTVGEVANNSSAGALATREASELVGGGNAIIDEVRATMQSIAESVTSTASKIQELGKSSEQIGRIVAVIKEIADQTNLLALNAAIEAARAGEHGRGFSVVAAEVRELANRTSKSTQDIAQTIAIVQTETRNAVANMKADTEKVANGIETATRLSNSQVGITKAVQQADDTVMQIAFSAIQQSASVQQIRTNIQEMGSIAERSAAEARQSARTCEEIGTIAHDLQQGIARFHLGS
jgi:methyl-accepting chemotaxis protein